MNVQHLVQSGAFLLLQRQEKEAPTPWLKEHPERRPHIFGPGHLRFLKHEAAAFICVGGLVVYENVRLEPEHPRKHLLVPRMFKCGYLPSFIVPPDEVVVDDLPGGWRPIDVVTCDRSVEYARAVMDRWFGFQWLGAERKLTGDVLGVYSERPLAAPLQDPMID